MSHNYAELLSSVKKILDDFDPLGLLKQGAPQNEYDEEIEKIVAGLPKCKSARDAEKLIHRVFTEAFGDNTAGDESAYSKIAALLFKIIDTG